MLKKLKELNRLNITLFLIAMSLFCFGLSMMRFLVTDTKLFLFLNWNVLLAFIPWLISSIIIVRGLTKKIPLAFLVFSWLIFFPNSPYILTDLFHLQSRSSAPIWYDLIVILSFAWTGLVYGFVSLMDIERLFRRRIGARLTNLISVLFLFLGSLGIYLGRYLRWNSWDVVSNPFGLFSDIFDRFFNPSVYPGAWAMTILMGILLNMMYFSIKLMKKNNEI